MIVTLSYEAFYIAHIITAYPIGLPNIDKD